MGIGFGINQLGCNANLASRMLHLTFQNIAHLSNKSQALSLHSANDALLGPAVVDGSSRGIEACRQSRIRDDPPVPNAVDQLVLADDPVAVAHQKDEKVKHLRFERDQLGP